jgi:hypothetical protein
MKVPGQRDQLSKLLLYLLLQLHQPADSARRCPEMGLFVPRMERRAYNHPAYLELDDGIGDLVASSARDGARA